VPTVVEVRLEGEGWQRKLQKNLPKQKEKNERKMAGKVHSPP
jgi:hypothetical protein